VLPTAERSVVVARLTGLNHVDVIGGEDDVPDISDGPITPQAPVWGRPPGAAIGAVGRAVGDDGRVPATGSRSGRVHLLRGAVRTYAWVRGPHLPSPPEDPVPQRTPEAELWLGTHPGDPAR
jgi:hypothetical protein